MKNTPPEPYVDLGTLNDGFEDMLEPEISWSVIFAGAVATAALAIILIALGSGIGFASVSPWPGAGISPVGFTAMAAIWLVVVQWVSTGVGGYLTGRLRRKSVRIHSHETFLRDTAHGFLSWAIATIIGVTLLASAASHMLGSARQTMTSMAKNSGYQDTMISGNSAGKMADPLAFYVDNLFRSEHPETNISDADMRGESERILVGGIANNGQLDESDRAYLAQLISTKTGLSLPEAGKRIDDVMAKEKSDEIKARQVINEARKASATISMYVFLSMLIGAFIASVAAALGGRHRDEGWAVPTEY